MKSPHRGSHMACNEMIVRYGKDTKCCRCIGHDCPEVSDYEHMRIQSMNTPQQKPKQDKGIEFFINAY